MQKILAVVTVGCGLLCLGCSKSTEVGDGADRIEPHILDGIEGVVTDYYDNNPLTGVIASVQLDCTTLTTTSDSNGYYLLAAPLPWGDYVVTFSLDGYAVIEGSAHIPSLEELRFHDVFPIPYEIPFRTVLDMQMYALDGTVTGTIVGAGWDIPDPPDDSICIFPPFWDMKVGLIFEDETHLGQMGVRLEPKEYWTYVDYDGFFRFTNVPLTDSAELVTPPFARGDNVYRGTRQTVPIRPDLIVIVPVVDTSFDATYSYLAYDRNETPVVQGLLAITYTDSSRFTGIWRLEPLSDSNRTGHSIGSGVLRGNRDQSEIWINLDPDKVDSNTLLRGSVRGNIFTGAWEYVGFPGVLDHGTFLATKQ